MLTPPAFLGVHVNLDLGHHQSTFCSRDNNLFSCFRSFVCYVNNAFYRSVSWISNKGSKQLNINLRLNRSILHSRALKTESRCSWDYFHQDCPVRRRFEIEFLKVRNSCLEELFHISWKIQPFEILKSCLPS